jgi:AbrB family looped-hinge helix DNA binding protein
VVLPKPVRDRLGLHAGSDLEIRETAEGVVLTPVEQKPSLVKEGRFGFTLVTRLPAMTSSRPSTKIAKSVCGKPGADAVDEIAFTGDQRLVEFRQALGRNDDVGVKNHQHLSGGLGESETHGIALAGLLEDFDVASPLGGFARHTAYLVGSSVSVNEDSGVGRVDSRYAAFRAYRLGSGDSGWKAGDPWDAPGRRIHTGTARLRPVRGRDPGKLSRVDARGYSRVPFHASYLAREYKGFPIPA